MVLRVRVSVSASACLSHSLRLARNGQANVWRMEMHSTSLAERGVVHAPCSGRPTGIRELVAPFTLCPMMLAPC